MGMYVAFANDKTHLSDAVLLKYYKSIRTALRKNIERVLHAHQNIESPMQELDFSCVDNIVV